MNIGIVVAILGVLVAAVPTYFLAKSNARDNERQKQADVEKAIAPIRQELADEKDTTRRLRARVDELQDKLYGRTT